MKTFFVLAFATLLIASGIFFWLNPDMLWRLLPGGGGEPAPQQPAPETPVQHETLTYASSTLGITLRYPAGYSVDEAYAYPFGAQKTIPDAVRFSVPAAIATGTNLSADSYISIEQLPNARNCTGDIYIVPNVPRTTLTEGGVEYSLATTSEAGAGNRYEERVYARVGSQPCTAVRYFLHYTALENYPAGSVREFDRAELLRQFDDIRRSLRLSASASATTSTSSAAQ